MVEESIAAVPLVRTLLCAVPLAAASVASIISSPQAARAAENGEVTRRTLPSGLRVIVAERPGTGLVALDMRVREGSGAETPATSGTAHFVEHLVFKGTDTRKPGDIDRAIELLGGELTAQTTRDATRYAVMLPVGDSLGSPGWQGALEVMADMLRHPAFRAADVAAEKPVILAEMAIVRTEPMRAGSAALATSGGLFAAGEPYRLPLMGTAENVRQMTPDALRAFWKRAYRPDDMTLAVTGDVRADDVFDAASRLFPADPAAPPDEPAAAPPTPAGTADAAPAVVRVPADADGPRRDLVTVLLGFRAPAATETDDAVLSALLPLLADGSGGAGGGESGRLAEALVQRQKLALSVSADLVDQRQGGMVVLAATGRRADAARLEAALRGALRKLPEDGFTAADAAAGVSAVLAARAGEAASLDRLAARLALADVLGVPPEEADDPAHFAAHLRAAVTPETLAAVARKYLNPDQGAITLVGVPAGGAAP